MKLLFHIILIYILSLVGTIDNSMRTINGCGDITLENKAPAKREDCKDDSELCCYIKLKGNSYNSSFCFPAPSKMVKSDVADEIRENTGFTVEELWCFDQKIRYMIGNLLLILFILI